MREYRIPKKGRCILPLTFGIFHRVLVISRVYFAPMKNFTIFIPLFLFVIFCNAQQRNDIIITEIMADPSPVVGLPNYEWVELTNHSTSTVDLFNWRLGDAGSLSGAFPHFILGPGESVIVCGSSAYRDLSVIAPTIAIPSFPSLDNESNLLYLRSAGGNIIHSLYYNLDWYHNELKKEGGWSLEMIDKNHPCGYSVNWTASISPSGGTPGAINSVNALNGDTISPLLINTYVVAPDNIRLLFDEPLDSLQSTLANNYSMDNLVLVSIKCIPPLFTEVEITIHPGLDSSSVYMINVKNIRDCSGREITEQKMRIGIPSLAKENDIVINEILFDPKPNNYDWVEFYNRSQQIIDAATLYTARKDITGRITDIKPVSASPRYLYPGDYIVLTENPELLELEYLVKERANVLRVKSLPSLPDNEGIILVLNAQGAIINEVHYYDDWHFKLLNLKEGISLERLDPEKSSNDRMNWHSAASTAGFGTPGYRNSQFNSFTQNAGAISIQPVTFSPDNDGLDDITFIHYALERSGFVANITIYDFAGRPVRKLVKNALLGLSGSWYWDGLDDNHHPLPFGPYIIDTVFFNLEGKKVQYKTLVLLAKKLKR